MSRWNTSGTLLAPPFPQYPGESFYHLPAQRTIQIADRVQHAVVFALVRPGVGLVERNVQAARVPLPHVLDAISKVFRSSVHGDSISNYGALKSLIRAVWAII